MGNIKKQDNQMWGMKEYVPANIGDRSKINIIGKPAGNKFLSIGLRQASTYVDDYFFVIRL